MNTDLVTLCNNMKVQISNETTFHFGIKSLLMLRQQLFDILLHFKSALRREDFYAMPFINDNGFQSKTIAYSIWHIFRIEDIVSHTLVSGDTQIFFSGNYRERIGSPIITTGNELVKQQIADFSVLLNIEELYQYATEVKACSDIMLNKLTFADLNRVMTTADRTRLESLCVVSRSDNARWLIDYWCGEDLKGLLLMPFSEHWLAHIYACMMIRDNIYSKK